MFLPNTKGMWSRRLSRNQYAEFTYAPPVEVPCAIVHELRKNIKTPVRTDSSASRGAAEEKVALTKILFPRTVAIQTNDLFEINGVTLRAVAIEQRFSVLGNLDHFEVDFDMHPQ